MIVKCEIDTKTGKINTTADDKHIPHSSFAVGSFMNNGDGLYDQYGYYSWNSLTQDGSTETMEGSLKADDPSSHKTSKYTTMCSIAKAMANIIRQSFLYEGIKDIFKPREK